MKATWGQGHKLYTIKIESWMGEKYYVRLEFLGIFSFSSVVLKVTIIRNHLRALQGVPSQDDRTITIYKLPSAPHAILNNLETTFNSEFILI